MSAAIPFREARAIVISRLSAHRHAPASTSVPLSAAHGRVLAEDVFADRDYPTLDRTARDGFAVRSADMPGRVRVIGEVRAGERFDTFVAPGEAVEIMTGAPIPPGADTVVMIEHVDRDGDFISCSDRAPAGQFINFRGGESPAGALLLAHGTRLGFAEIGLLASVGIAQPRVFEQPRIAILATGDELVEPHQTPEAHQIRNSNAYSLAAQVERAGGIPLILPIARDDESQTRRLIEQGLHSDLLLLSGGVSAGKYDVVETALQNLHAQFFFDRVAIQPGQPLVFGRARERFFFGLPGNPASTMVTFELFARTALEMLSGQPAREPIFPEAVLTRDYRHRPGLTRFLPATVTPDGQLTPTSWTGSSDIAAISRSNAWMVVDPDRSEWKAGDRMPILIR